MNYVPGYGPSNAKVILVGESPGREEVARGIPFIGPAGRLLDSMLGRVGINRQECYVTNIMKTRPPGDNFGFFYEANACGRN